MAFLKFFVFAVVIASAVSEEKRGFLDAASVLAGRIWNPIVGSGSTGAACRSYGYCNNPQQEACKQGGGGIIGDVAGSIYANTVGNAVMTDSMKKASCVDLGFYIEPTYVYDPPTYYEG